MSHNPDERTHQTQEPPGPPFAAGGEPLVAGQPAFLQRTLADLEAVLREHPAVQHAVVVAREDAPGARELVAYVVLHEQKQAESADLAHLVGQQLPSCPPPTAFVFLRALPVTQNGTVDLRRLPPPERESRHLRDDAPRTRLEEVVASVWTQVLTRESGMHDDFFALGGNSLLAMQVMAKLRATLGVEVPLNAFFEDPTAAHLARLIEQLQAKGQASAHLPLAAVSRATYRVPEGG